MKEFNSQTGGRYTYIDDIINLQELALAFGSIFDACDNFIVSGCEVVSGASTEGIVWLNGKLRRVPATQGVTLPLYINESNKSEFVPYASGDQKVGRTSYGCTVSQAPPSAVDEVSGKTQASITIDSAGKAMRLNDAFFGKYALLKDPSLPYQTVKGQVNFTGTVMAKQMVSDRVNISGTGVTGSILYNDKNLVIQTQSSASSGRICELTVSPDSGWGFRVNGSTVLRLTQSECVSSVPFQASQIRSGSLVINGTNIYNTTNATDLGEININMIGYNGGVAKRRTVKIGDGAGSTMIEARGTTGQVYITAQLFASSPNETGLILTSSYLRTSSSFAKSMMWSDTSGVECARIGFSAGANSVFAINNKLGDVNVKGVSAVNIGPVIKENGVKLSDKYVLKDDFDTITGTMADASKVYSMTSADSKFASKANGLSQFVTSTNTKAVLCGHIGAATIAAVDKCVSKEALLSDMATSDELKKQIRQNIGAAGVDDVPAKPLDSGWVEVDSSGLFARAIGSVVCVQGRVKTHHTGVVFRLPNSIPAPMHDVTFSTVINSDEHWSCCIPAGTKNCIVSSCHQAGSHRVVSFSITYMT